MYNLSVAPVNTLGTGGVLRITNKRFNVRLTGDNPRTDLTTSGKIFVNEFNPRDYTTRHTDTEKILASGGYTSQYYVQSKDFILSATVYGTRAEIESFRRLFPMGKEIALMWWDTPSGAATLEGNVGDIPYPKYIFCKTQGITSPETPEMYPLDDSDSCAVFNIRLRATDPFIQDADRTLHLSIPTITLTQTNKTRVVNIGSNICHIPSYLTFTWQYPEFSTEVAHTITNTTTDTSVTLTFNLPVSDENIRYQYNLWTDYGRKIYGYLSDSTSLSTITINDTTDLSYWDGQFLEFAPGSNTLTYSIDPNGPDTISGGVVTATRWGTMAVGTSYLYL